MQKFHKYDHVQIAKELCNSMSHFTSDTDAVVISSSDDEYGDGDTDSYTLYVNGEGETAWYYEDQLTLIDKNGKPLLKKWEKERKIKSDKESDIDWIFENGTDVLNGASGATVGALASCLGISNLWGSRGEGFQYYINAMAVLEIATPFLKNGDKAGWIEFCKNKKPAS